ncbi:helix-turn-helix transcriptional regulator [Lysobacter sp. 5GHs7-4]|uniref:helix-turn-helix domain-containing protein n=1 Tax=Lysobacter sp. 5GHs7-4 TaxID=2904253 RepID=UPI001E2E4C4C|nr:helix-turn-helix transcriptional regulator [Lysobacter sp. 5GHs7-4]UHQ22746.1 helix-turn-helix transcriptional regulator [Lysobacter sp. 5GHs7-4]
MDYREQPAPPSLSRHVQCLWRLRDDDPAPQVQAIYADGRCELIAHTGAPMRLHGADGGSQLQAPLLFAAQQRGPIRLQPTGPVHCLGLRLTPAGSGLIAGARLAPLRDRIPDLHELDPAFAAAFAQAARACLADQGADELWRLLAQRAATHEPDDAIERAVALLDHADGDLRIADLADAVGLGLRNLQTRFLAEVGMTAKEYARVRRLQGLLRSLDEERSAIADAAARHGYSDQAHATHDLGRWTGTTPARLVRALRGDREGEATLRLAAAFVRGHSGVRAVALGR